MAVGSTYFPGGRSIWEFGTNEDPADKFKKDYKKRVRETDAGERAKLTFVFVTPRNWDNPKLKLPDWLKTYKCRKDFADIWYIDGAMLETWLEQHGAVGAKHARLVLGRVPRMGARSTDEFWIEFSARYRPKLTEAVALCARKGQVDQMVSHVMGKGGSLVFVGDGPDEVSAVAVAAIRSAPVFERHDFEVHTLRRHRRGGAAGLCPRPVQLYCLALGEGGRRLARDVRPDHIYPRLPALRQQVSDGPAPLDPGHERSASDHGAR